MSRISIIIPAYNAAKYIATAIESVLRQTYRDYEIVVVDDGSTDDTYQCLQPYLDRIVYVYQDNQKLPGARNTGVAASSGDYLAFLDADDTFLSHKLGVQVAVLDAQPDVGLVASGFEYIDEHGRVLQIVRPRDSSQSISLESLLYQGLAPVHAVLVRRSWFQRVGGFDRRFAYCEDMDFWYRLALAGCAMVWAPGIVCQYRMHHDAMTQKIRVHYEWLFQVLDKLFDTPGVPPAIQQQHDDVYAHILLSEAGRLYATNDLEGGQECVSRAIGLNPDLIAAGDVRLADTIVAWRQSVWTKDKQGFWDLVLNHLPPEVQFTNQERRRLIVRSAKDEFYRAHMMKDFDKVRRHWAAIATKDPRWLLDRGALSILMQTFGYKGYGNRTS